jgi:PPM family protein phosphatase
MLKHRGFIAHVGDSRIYLLRGGRVVQLTEDHSLVNELIKRGKLNETQAESSPYKNAVTRAVGVYESVEVDTIDFDVLPGDHFLLASDGLTGYLKDDEIVPTINKAEGDIKRVPGEFIELANSRGGKDNITNIIVKMQDSDGEGSAFSQEVNLKIETLRKMPLFKYLTYKELVKIMNITKMVEVNNGTPIIKDGESGEELFIVLNGEVSVHKGEKQLVTLQNGDHFGEMALIDKAPRSADVTAIESTRLLKMTRGDFFEIIRKESQLASKLLWSFVQVLSDRLRKTNQELKGMPDSIEYEDLTAELFNLPETPPDQTE